MSAIAVAFGLAFAVGFTGCDSPTGYDSPTDYGGGGGGGNPFLGYWVEEESPDSIGITLHVWNTDWSLWGDGIFMEGTYTRSGNTATLHVEDYGPTKLFSTATATVHGGTLTITAGTEMTMTFVRPITLTITGIPTAYLNGYGEIELWDEDTGSSAWGYARITGPSATFPLFDATVGNTYEISLYFTRHGPRLGVYSASIDITGRTNTVAFSQFTSVPPSIVITVTGIPAHYNWGYIETHGRNVGGTITGSSAVFLFWGTTDDFGPSILLNLGGPNNWGRYEISTTLGATNTIPLSEFNLVEGGAVINVTVTGIPSRYHGNWGALFFYQPGTDIEVYLFEVGYVTASITFSMIAAPGVYDLVLWLNSFTVEYSLPNKTISSGTNTIAFSDFTLVPHGLSAAWNAKAGLTSRAATDSPRLCRGGARGGRRTVSNGGDGHRLRPTCRGGAGHQISSGHVTVAANRIYGP